MPVNHVSEYPQLLNTVLAGQKIVYLCGAGASMSLGSHSLSWVNWILAGKQYLTLEEQDELDHRIGTWTTDELVDAATFLLNQLKASDFYHTFMNRTIGALHPVNTAFMDAFHKVWRAGDLIATTNYDIQIEETLGAKGISYGFPLDILSVIRSTSENKVIHLHGMYDQENSIDDIIADGPQYQKILENSGAQFIQNLIGTNPIIIVGCGGTMEDPNLSGFMSFASEKLGASEIPYFFLMKKGDTIPNLPSNAIPVFYGDDYTDLPAFLSELAVIRLRQRVGLQFVASVNPYGDRKLVTSAFGRMHFANGFNSFVGRISEMNELNAFLQCKDKFSWWTILGEGGIGKSRLILEWMKTMPLNWFGFFAGKNAGAVYQFAPFTDTVVAFDYVLGQERQCAETVGAFLEIFRDSPYKLRIVLVERHQKSSNDDWLLRMKREMLAETRLEFESGNYLDHALNIGMLEEAEEFVYIENYLNLYLPLVENSRFIAECRADTKASAEKIQSAFRTSMERNCLRPLFLSVFIEVWISKEGHTNLSSAEELLSEYLDKEKKRWKCILLDDTLVDSYLRLLSVACIIGSFNVIDVQGTNYLEEDCKRFISFLDTKSDRPGADNLFEELFVSMSELEQSEENNSFEMIWQKIDQKLQEMEKIQFSEKWGQEERLALVAPYIKMNADPQEVYLNMLVNVDAATEEEKKELSRLREKRIEREQKLPDYAWILEPCFPDIIKEYIVAYTVNKRNAEHFAKLVRANSVLGLANFISLALDDWPDNEVFQKIAITPPDEVLNYSEYYLGLMPCIATINNLKAVENSILESEPIFLRYAIEIWRRIAIVLTDRENVERLFDSSLNYIRYIRKIAKLMEVGDEAADVVDAYCVGLHNAEAVEEFASFLKECSDLNQLLSGNKKMGLICCENYGRLIHLRLYETPDADLYKDWCAIKELLKQNDYDEAMCRSAVEAADEYFHTLLPRKNEEELAELEQSVAEIYQKSRLCKAAEIVALCIVNRYVGKSQRDMPSDVYEEIKQYWQEFPDSTSIQAAFIRASNTFYAQMAEYKRVPDKIINTAKNWSQQYPDEIEFQEGYFDLLFSKLKYAMAHDMRNEKRRVLREMKTVAERADYSEYNKPPSIP